MSEFFCSDLARQSGIFLGGTARHYETYFLIECPPPWTSYDLDSRQIPENLRALGDRFYRRSQPITRRILLIYNPAYFQPDRRRVIIYHKSQGFANRYEHYEFFVSDLAEVAPAIERFLKTYSLELENSNSQVRDLLICTHGQNDRCCARYGKPLYYKALKMSDRCDLANLRIWQTSHIGGHHLAPTAIDFPQGRYYGHLDLNRLQTILTRSGSILDLYSVYRGWGLLPNTVQVLEKELLKQWGWDGLNYAVQFRSLKAGDRVELDVRDSRGAIVTYQADITLDSEQHFTLPGSCCQTYQVESQPWKIENLIKISLKATGYSNPK